MINHVPNTQPGRRYNIEETCEMLGISRTTLYKYTQKGMIVATKHRGTGKTFYSSEDIQRFWRGIF